MRVEILKNRLELYLAAEKSILAGQSYKIGNRELTRADLRAVQETIADLDAQIESAMRPTGKIKAVTFG